MLQKEYFKMADWCYRLLGQSLVHAVVVNYTSVDILTCIIHREQANVEM